jgi:hypothetical protein
MPRAGAVCRRQARAGVRAYRGDDEQVQGNLV